MKRKTFVIAEIGVNHNGDLNRALEMIDAAAEARVDAVKFQTFNVDDLVTRNVPKARYQQSNIGGNESQFSMLKRLQLTVEDHHELYAHCCKNRVEFMSTAFDLCSLQFLVKELGVQRLKIASGEVTNGPLLLEHARSGMNILMSTGMASLSEIHQALVVLAYGYLRTATPSRSDREGVLDLPSGREKLKEKVTLLQCTTQYPAPVEEANVRAILGMREEFGLSVGYSDHTAGITTAIVAIAFGASVIEKHLTLDRSLPGPDHKASIEPGELSLMVQAIEDAERCLGGKIKAVQRSEKENISVARKSIVATRVIAKGEVFSSDNIAIKRPGTGQSPMNYWDLLGVKSTQDYEEDELIL